MNGKFNHYSDNIFIDMGSLGSSGKENEDEILLTINLDRSFNLVIHLIEENKYSIAFENLLYNTTLLGKEIIIQSLAKMIFFDKILNNDEDQIDYMKNNLFPLLTYDYRRKKEIFKVILQNKNVIRSDYYSSVLKSKFKCSIIKFFKNLQDCCDSDYLNNCNDIKNIEEEIIVLIINYLNDSKRNDNIRTFDEFIKSSFNHNSSDCPKDIIDKFLIETKKIVFVAKREENNKIEQFSQKDINNIEITREDYMLKKEKKNVKIKALKNYNFRYTKRENIDKKVLRKFRKYLKESVKKKLMKLEERHDFLKIFIKKNLFPPFEYNEYEFKSFNTKYLMWLFSQPYFSITFNSFIDNTGLRLIQFLYSTFDIRLLEDKLHLKNYVLNFSSFYVNENIFNNRKTSTDIRINDSKLDTQTNDSKNINKNNEINEMIGEDDLTTEKVKDKEKFNSLGDIFVEYGLDLCLG